MIRHFLTGQFVRFLAAGSGAAAVNWLARIALSLWLPFWAAVALAYLVGLTVAFMLNIWIVFPDASRPRGELIWQFLLTNLASFPIVWLTAVSLLKLFSFFRMTFYAEEIAHMIALAMPLIWVFAIYKFIIFKERT